MFGNCNEEKGFHSNALPEYFLKVTTFQIFNQIQFPKKRQT